LCFLLGLFERNINLKSNFLDRILGALTETAHKLGTITAFIVVFLGMISYASVAKPFEVLAATAA
jgi:hypothetical protein